MTVASTDFASTRSVAAKISPDDPIPESRVLFVTITNMSRFPVDIDVLYRVFSRYGTVEKVSLIFYRTALLGNEGRYVFYHVSDCDISKTKRPVPVVDSAVNHCRGADGTLSSEPSRYL